MNNILQNLALLPADVKVIIGVVFFIVVYGAVKASKRKE